MIAQHGKGFSGACLAIGETSGFVLFKLKQNEKVFQSGSYPISDSIEYKLDNCNLEETENGK